jgi:hypothetical protein
VAFFSRKIKTAEFASSPIKAAAGIGRNGAFPMYGYLSNTFEMTALSLPTVSRARDLLASTISGLEFRQYVKQWNGTEYEEIYVPNESWMENPDPKVPRQFILANTVTDLWISGRAFWAVTSRNATDGRPMSFQWIPASQVSTPNQEGPQFFSMPDTIKLNGVDLDPNEVITFLAPTTGLMFSGRRAVSIATHLDQYADRAATIETVPGYLQQTAAGETMSGEELGDLASQWAQARREGNVIGALNNYVNFVEFDRDPLEVNAAQREYQALDLSRICSVPAYLVSAPTPGASMTYQNASQARQDLWLFGAQMYAEAITSRLSMNDVVSRGRYVCFDTDELLAIGEMADALVEPQVPDLQEMPS